MSEARPLSSLALDLQALCQGQRTGTLLIVTEDNNLAQVVLEKGTIVSMSFKGKHGQEALELIQHIPAGRGRFHERLTTAAKATLPTTAEILALLGSSGGRQQTMPPAQGSSARPPQTPPGGMVVSPEQQTVLQTALAAFLGPIAPVVCAEYIAQSRTLEEVLQKLTAEISDTAAARRFQETVRRLL